MPWCGPDCTRGAMTLSAMKLIVVATEFMLRVASLDLDGGHTQASRTLLGIASGLAHESSDLALNAWVLARWGEQKIHEKDLGQALAYTRAAAELARQAPPRPGRSSLRNTPSHRP